VTGKQAVDRVDAWPLRIADHDHLLYRGAKRARHRDRRVDTSLGVVAAVLRDVARDKRDRRTQPSHLGRRPRRPRAAEARRGGARDAGSRVRAAPAPDASTSAAPAVGRSAVYPGNRDAGEHTAAEARARTKSTRAMRRGRRRPASARPQGGCGGRGARRTRRAKSTWCSGLPRAELL
jgi:hypothetical protein